MKKIFYSTCLIFDVLKKAAEIIVVEKVQNEKSNTQSSFLQLRLIYLNNACKMYAC